MTVPHDRRRTNERRALERRNLTAAQRAAIERRAMLDRRSGLERRLSILSAEGQIHEALRLLTQVIERGAVPDEEQRGLESAMVRLRFALDRLEDGDG